MNRQGREKWDRYLELKRLMRKATDPDEKKKLKAQFGNDEEFLQFMREHRKELSFPTALEAEWPELDLPTLIFE